MHIRTIAGALLAKGVISRGWYAILTGLAMLVVAYLLGSVGADADPAAPFVALAFGVGGVAVAGRGVREELRRRRRP